MRNLMILAALFVLALGQLCAQITTYHDTLPDGTTLTLVDSGQPPIEVMIDSMFGSLDFTDVSTGLLMDRTIHFVDYTRYDGTLSDSNQVDYRTFLSLYASLYSAPLDTSQRPLPDLPTYKATAGAIRDNGEVPVGALLMDYQRIDTLALEDSLLALDGMQLPDMGLYCTVAFQSKIRLRRSRGGVRAGSPRYSGLRGWDDSGTPAL